MSLAPMPGSRGRRGSVLSLVERGWRGARECSIALSARGIPVTHVIKGSLAREVRGMIQPHPGVGVCHLPRPVFRVCLWFLLVVQAVRRRFRWVLIDNERTLRELGWCCRWLQLTPVLIQERHNRYELTVRGRRITLEALSGDAAG